MALTRVAKPPLIGERWISGDNLVRLADPVRLGSGDTWLARQSRCSRKYVRGWGKLHDTEVQLRDSTQELPPGSTSRVGPAQLREPLAGIERSPAPERRRSASGAIAGSRASRSTAPNFAMRSAGRLFCSRASSLAAAATLPDAMTPTISPAATCRFTSTPSIHRTWPVNTQPSTSAWSAWGGLPASRRTVPSGVRHCANPARSWSYQVSGLVNDAHLASGYRWSGRPWPRVQAVHLTAAHREPAPHGEPSMGRAARPMTLKEVPRNRVCTERPTSLDLQPRSEPRPLRARRSATRGP